ncbi:MAG: hypothetical protein HYZ53_03030 [Planctomycetes bacterium]|nr:hypothetical protein [Planctomycetota bacterium]
MRGVSLPALLGAALSVAMLILAPGFARADLIPTSTVSEVDVSTASTVPSAPAGSVAGDAPCVAAGAAAATVASARLQALGLSAAEAEGRLAQLSPEETAQLAANPERAQVAGLVGFEIAAVVVGTILVGWFLWWLLHVHEK